MFAERVQFNFTAWHGGAAEELAAGDLVARVRAWQSGFHGTQHQMSNHDLTPHERGVTCLTYIVARHYLLIDGAHHHAQATGGYYTNELIAEDGAWRIAACRLSGLWTKGDRALFDSAAQRWVTRGTHPPTGLA